MALTNLDTDALTFAKGTETSAHHTGGSLSQISAGTHTDRVMTQTLTNALGAGSELVR